MPYNLEMSYSNTLNLDKNFLNKKSVLIIGAGKIVNHYAFALSKMGIKNVTIISKNQKSSIKICEQYGFKPLFGGYENTLSDLPKMDLVIVATPIPILLSAAQCALENNQTNILIEKPGSLYYHEIISLSKKFPNANIKIAYNRLQYPNFHLLKKLTSNEGGITSCNFTITEWVDKIDFTKFSSSLLARWGLTNSIHVISMVFELIGFPKIFTPYQFGTLDWHPSGSIFTGSGISDKDIPFSYHADWNSAGRWGIDIMTNENSYRLIPLEELHVCKKNSTQWKKVPFQVNYPDIKQGFVEQLSLMLEKNSSSNSDLVSLEKSVKFNKITEKIFGYS